MTATVLTVTCELYNRFSCDGVTSHRESPDLRKRCERGDISFWISFHPVIPSTLLLCFTVPAMNPPPPKRTRDDGDAVAASAVDGHGEDEKDRLIAVLRSEIALLRDRDESYYASNDCVRSRHTRGCIPEAGSSARHVKERIVQTHELGALPSRGRPSALELFRTVTDPTPVRHVWQGHELISFVPFFAFLRQTTSPA
jgi:hypothetical protein